MTKAQTVALELMKHQTEQELRIARRNNDTERIEALVHILSLIIAKFN